MMNKLRFYFLISSLIIASIPASSQVKYSIKGNIKGLKDTTIYLANYFGNKLYYNDTTKVDSKGNFTFKGKPYGECGKYAMVMPGPKYFDFIVADENIVIEADADNDIEKIKVKESENNKLFFDYIRFINSKMKMRVPIDAVLNDSTKTEADKEPSLAELKRMNDEVISYQRDLIAKHPDMLVSKLIKMTMEIEIPQAPDSLADDAKKRWSYYYFRKHYWDNCDLTDPRLVRDQAYHKLIEKFITQTLPQIPDTMTIEAKNLITKTAGNADGFKYLVHQFTYNFETSKIMCMDEGFVFMVDNYYAKNLCSWMKPDKIEEMKKAADEKRYCLCGEVGLDIVLPDMNGKWISMNDLDAKYTLLVIWEATCGHCKKEIPKINDLYNKWKSKGLAVYGVHNNLEVDKWKAFVEENHLDFVNVSRNSAIMNQDSATKLIYGHTTTIQSLNFHQYWDVNSTPKVYLMDKDHKILAKSLSAEQLDELIGKLESGGDTTAPIKEHEYEDEDDMDNSKSKPPVKGMPKSRQPAPSSSTPKK